VQVQAAERWLAVWPVVMARGERVRALMAAARQPVLAAAPLRQRAPRVVLAQAAVRQSVLAPRQRAAQVVALASRQRVQAAAPRLPVRLGVWAVRLPVLALGEREWAPVAAARQPVPAGAAPWRVVQAPTVELVVRGQAAAPLQGAQRVVLALEPARWPTVELLVQGQAVHCQLVPAPAERREVSEAPVERE
jgi:hypothetical protein